MKTDFALSCPVPLTDRKTHRARPRQRRQLTAQLVRDLFLPAFGNDSLRQLDDQADLARLARPRSLSPPTPSWSRRSSFRAATSASSRSTARSTTSPWAARGRCSSRLRSSWKRACRSPTSRASSRRWRQRATRPESLVTGDTKVVKRAGRQALHHHLRRRTGARTTRSSPPPNARPGDRRDLSAAPSAITASPSCPCAKASSSKAPFARDTAPLHSLGRDAMLAAGEKCTVCAIPPAAALRAR